MSDGGGGWRARLQEIDWERFLQAVIVFLVVVGPIGVAVIGTHEARQERQRRNDLELAILEFGHAQQQYFEQRKEQMLAAPGGDSARFVFLSPPDTGRLGYVSLEALREDRRFRLPDNVRIESVEVDPRAWHLQVAHTEGGGVCRLRFRRGESLGDAVLQRLECRP